MFGRISFFVNAGVRFIEEHAKLRAMAVLWEELGRERYGVEDEKHRRLRYGVQVNSLGLTEAQPENNVYRIALEALAVTLGRDARARAIQLPAWNEALGLPRPWDQQWSLRLQQILAYETDLLEYPDIFEGSKVMDGLVEELLAGARAEIQKVAELGGAVEAVDYMKSALVESHRKRWQRIESGEHVVVGMNRFTSTEPSPLTAGADGGILVVDPQVEAEQREALERWRAGRDQGAVERALRELARVAADDDENIMPATIAAARAGATTGRVVPDAARGLRRIPRPDRRHRRRRGAQRRGFSAPGRGRACERGARPPPQVPGRQAGAGRPLQWRRADRGPRAGRRDGRGLRGNSPHPHRRSRTPPLRKASTWSDCRSSRARTGN